MGIPLGSNFDVQTGLPLDSRAQVLTLVARDAIPSLRRWEGMIVYVKEDQTSYSLKGGLTNDLWEPVGSGAGGGGNAIYLAGDIDTDGAVRLIVDSGSFLIECRVSGVWKTKYEFVIN